MEKKSVSSAVIKSVVLVVLGALVILGIYLIFNRNKNVAKEEDYVLTAVDEITTTDLSKSYPADARMIKISPGSITCCSPLIITSYFPSTGINISMASCQWGLKP